MSRRLLIIAVPILAGILVWLLYWTPAEVSTGVDAGPHRRLELATPPAGGDFVLTSARGPFDLAELRGQVVILYFGYTWCPDICPTNLVLIANALKGLTPDELDRVEVVFVSVDPERDTPGRLAEYSGYFHSKIHGVTGTPEQIAEVARRYGAAYRRTDVPGSAMGYVVDHSAYSYVVDPQGRLARILDHATPSDEIVATIRSLLDREQRGRDARSPG